MECIINYNAKNNLQNNFIFKGLLMRYQINSEGELFSNSFSELVGVLDNNRLPSQNESTGASIVQQKVFDIFARYRTSCLDQFSKTWKDEMRNKNENVFSFKISPIPQKMMDLAVEFHTLAKSMFFG